MAGRGDGGDRWGEAERHLVLAYLEDGRLDPDRVGSPAYLQFVKQREDLWKRHGNKNFYRNIRKQVNSWLNGNEGRGGGENDDDDDASAEVEGPAPVHVQPQGEFSCLYTA